MNHFKLYLFFTLLFAFTVNLNAQTHLSSQSFNGINYYNPANVGFSVNNTFQTFYRSQFEGVGNPYRTIGIGLDLGLFKSSRNSNNNHFGMGLQAVSEQLMGGLLQTNFITLSLANRIYLNENKSSYLAVGISATVITRTIDAEKLTFADQYNSGRLMNTSSLEILKNIPSRISNNGGIMFTNNTENAFFQSGASVYYINSSSDKQVVNNFQQTYQYIGMINYERTLWGEHTILGYADYQKRSDNEFIYVGAAYGIPFNVNNTGLNRMYFGCFYRIDDAVVPYFGLINNRYKIGLTYDIYQKSMSLSALNPQTFEFTLSSYIGRRKTELFKSLFN